MGNVADEQVTAMDAQLFNSLSEGDFGNGAPLGQGLLEGDFWARRLGCYCIYRGVGQVDGIDYDRIVTTGTSEGELTVPAWVTHEPDTSYFYAARRVSGTGKQEQGTMAVVRLSLDATGKRRPARPNCVRGLAGVPAAEGKVRLSWWYWPIGQAAAPVRFAVYGDAGSGVINYANPLAEVTYQGAGCHRVTVAAGSEGRYRFGVRAVTEGGVDDGNRALVEVPVDLTGPGELDGVSGQVSR